MITMNQPIVSKTADVDLEAVCQAQNAFAARFAAVVLLIQAGSIVSLKLQSPGYVDPLFANHVGLSLFVGLCIWQVLGLSLLFVRKPASRTITVMKYISVVLFCSVPLYLLTTVGPAIMVICEVFAPVVRG